MHIADYTIFTYIWIEGAMQTDQRYIMGNYTCKHCISISTQSTYRTIETDSDTHTHTYYH
jgi:hypothetical protein